MSSRINDVLLQSEALFDQGYFRVRTVRSGDVEFLALRLRSADRREIAAATGEDPLTALRKCRRISNPCFAVTGAPGEPVAIFGVVEEPIREDIGQVWMVGTDEVARHPIAFLQGSLAWTSALRRHYARLWNCVDERNIHYIHWLEWCGFRCLQRIGDYGFEQRPFLLFDLPGLNE